MQVVTTVTQKGQITLPKLLRQAVGINKYDKVLVQADKNYLIVKPTKDILDLAGSLTPKINKNRSPLEARKVLEKSYKRI